MAKRKYLDTEVKCKMKEGDREWCIEVQTLGFGYEERIVRGGSFSKSCSGLRPGICARKSEEG